MNRVGRQVEQYKIRALRHCASRRSVQLMEWSRWCSRNSTGSVPTGDPCWRRANIAGSGLYQFPRIAKKKSSSVMDGRGIYVFFSRITWPWSWTWTQRGCPAQRRPASGRATAANGPATVTPSVENHHIIWWWRCFVFFHFHSFIRGTSKTWPQYKSRNWRREFARTNRQY